MVETTPGMSYLQLAISGLIITQVVKIDKLDIASLFWYTPATKE